MAFLTRNLLIRSVLGGLPRALSVQQPTSYLVASNVLRFCSSQVSTQEKSDAIERCDEDLPDPTMDNPFLKEKRQCILCRYQIQVDYKNVRLLSQFISPYTGRLYDKHITGLCEHQHRALRKEFTRATQTGLMSPFYRDPKYANDPKLFDPTRPSRANPY